MPKGDAKYQLPVLTHALYPLTLGHNNCPQIKHDGRDEKARQSIPLLLYRVALVELLQHLGGQGDIRRQLCLLLPRITRLLAIIILRWRGHQRRRRRCCCCRFVSHFALHTRILQYNRSLLAFHTLNSPTAQHGHWPQKVTRRRRGYLFITLPRYAGGIRGQ